MVYQTKTAHEKQANVEDLSGLGQELDPQNVEIGAGDQLIHFEDNSPVTVQSQSKLSDVNSEEEVIAGSIPHSSGPSREQKQNPPGRDL